MKAALIFSLFSLVLAMLIGVLLLSSVINNANSTGAINGTAATHWNNMVNMTWVAVGILTIVPLVFIGTSIMGMFGGAGEER